MTCLVIMTIYWIGLDTSPEIRTDPMRERAHCEAQYEASKIIHAEKIQNGTMSLMSIDTTTGEIIGHEINAEAWAKRVTK